MPTAQIDHTNLGELALGAVPNMNNKGIIGAVCGVPVPLSLTAPAAASATYYLNAQSIASGGTVTVNKKADYPRSLTVVASGAATGNVVVSGYDTNGYEITETLALNGATAVDGKKSFSKVTTVALPTVAATTINLGTGVLFGLPFRMTAAGVFIATVDGAADSGLGTTAIGSATAGTDYYGTWSPATAPNGTHSYLMYFIPTDLASYGVNN